MSLAKREADRLNGIGDERGYKDKCALSWLIGMATIAGGLPLDRATELIEAGHMPLGLDGDSDVQGELQSAGMLEEGQIPPLTPDIVAAAFVHTILKRGTPKQASEAVWAAMEPDLEAGVDRVGRLGHDARVVLGITEPGIGSWLAEAVAQEPERSEALMSATSQAALPGAVLEASIAATRLVLERANDRSERARLFNNLSVHLSATGKHKEALKAIQKAVEIRRRLAKAHPARYEPDLAGSLHNLSVHLSATGENKVEALKAIQKAVEIDRRLAKAQPARYEADLAGSLHNLSNRLSETGDHEEALKAIQKAVEIRRRLAKTQPARYEPDLALSLNNLSNRLSATGDHEEALKAIQEAVGIRRRLAKAQPARYEPDLARSYGTLGGVWERLEESERACEAYSAGANLVRPYALTYPGSPYESLLHALESDRKRCCPD
jgi:tetratricopeptide (TPR) repeat protein